MKRAENLGGFAGAFGAGMVTGYLPCGLSWGAFVLATQVEPATAAVGLFLFGLDLVFLAGLLESGRIKPPIDRTYPLAETPDAMRQVGEGRVQGKVVISVNP